MPERRDYLQRRPTLDFGPTNVSIDDEYAALSQARVGRQHIDRLRRRLEQDPHLVGRANQLIADHASLSGQLLNDILTVAPYNAAADDLAEMDEGDDNSGGFLGFGKQVLGTVADKVADGLSLLNESVVKPKLRALDLVSESSFHELSRGIMATGALRQVGIGTAEAITPQESLRRFTEFGDSPLTNILQGQESITDQGSGYFMGGGARERTQQERTLEIEGQTANFGRYVANSTVGEMYNPGDMAYDLTAGVSEFAGAVVLDPLAWGAGGLAKGARAGRQFSRSFDELKNLEDLSQVTRMDRWKSRIGMIDTPKQRTLVAERTRAWLDSTDVYEQIAKADEYEVFQRWANSPSQRANREISRALGATRDPGEARQAVEGLIKKGYIENQGFFDGPGAFIRKTMLESDNLVSKKLNLALDPESRAGRLLLAEGRAESKFAGLAPEGYVTADNLDESALKLDSMLRQNNVPRERRAQVFSKMANLHRGDEGGLIEVWNDSLKAVADSIEEVAGRGLGKGPRQYSSRVIDDLADKFTEEVGRVQRSFGRVYAYDDVGEKVNASYAKKTKLTGWDGEEIDFVYPHPTATAELGSMSLPLPDASMLRRASEKGHLARTVYTKKGWGAAETVTNGFTNILFKPAVLLRPAFMVREFMEAQLALTAARFNTTALNNPVGWLTEAWHLGDDGWREVFDPGHIRRTAKEEGVSSARQLGRGVKNRFAVTSTREDWTDLVGEDWADGARRTNMIVSNAQGQVDLGTASSKVVARNFDMVPFDSRSRDNLIHWTQELGRLRASPEYVKMAEFNGNVDAWLDWATNNDTGRRYIDDLLDNTKRADVTREDALDELADIVRGRLEMVTGGFDEELFELFKAGNIPMPEKIVNGRLVRQNWDSWDGPTQAFMNTLRSKFDAGKHPRFLKAQKVETTSRFQSQVLDNLKDVIFNWSPSKFTRGPAFKEATVNRTAELMDMAASDELRDEVFDAAVKAWKLKPEDGAYRALNKARNETRGFAGEIDNLDDYEMMVRGKAVDDVTEAVFDVSNRGAAQDTFASFVPFLDAWKEMMTRWPKLIKDNPGFFVRAMAGTRELQQQGTFYTNDFGEMVFRYPGSGAMVKAIQTLQGGRASGEFDVALEGRVAGLNIATDSIGPGFGPLVQLSSGFFKDPDLDSVREMISPFGVDVDSAGELANPSTYLNQLVPAWFSKALTGFDSETNQRQFNSTAAQFLDAYSMSGDYDLNDPHQVSQMVEDAERAAQITLFTRSIFQAGAPTGPGAAVEVPIENADIGSEDWDPENDPDGKWFTVQQLASDYYRLAEIHGWDVAAEKWFDLYGKEPYFIAQPGSTSEGRELPVTEEGDDWMRRNQDIVDDYEHVAGYFAPEDEESGFSFTAYDRQHLQGKRKTLSAEEQAKLATSTRAKAMYHAVLERTEGLDPFRRRRVRREIRDKLEAVAPNWRNPGVTTTLPQREKIRQLEVAAFDSRLNDNPLAKPLRTYLEARQVALERTRSLTGRPNATLASQEAAPLRGELFNIGRELRTRYPEFAGVWSSLLANEIEEDDSAQ